MIDNPMPLSLTDYRLNLIQNETLLYFRANNGPINNIRCSFNNQEMQPATFIQTVQSNYSTVTVILNLPLNQGELWYNCSISSNNIIYLLGCSGATGLEYCVNSVTCFVEIYFKGI